MKLTIEIDDSTFARAIEKEVGKSIAKMAETAISERAEEILNLKVERKIKALLPKIFKGAQEAMQRAFIKSIGKQAKKQGK